MSLDAAWLDTSLHAPRPLAEIEADGLASRPDMGMIATRTARLRVRHQPAEGQPTVLVIPDGPNCIEHYDALFEAWRGRIGLLAVDPPGLGFSYALHPSALTYAGAVEALAQAVEALAIGPLVTTGACVNAYLAIGLAARLGDQVVGVVAGQATDLAGERRWIAQAVDPQGVLRIPIVGQLTWARPEARRAMAVDTWYGLAAGPGFDTSGWRTAARWSIACGCANAMASTIQLWFGADAVIEVPVVARPAVIMWGEADRTHAKAGSDPEGLRTFLPKAELHYLPRVGHFTDLEDLAAFEAAVRAVLI